MGQRLYSSLTIMGSWVVGCLFLFLPSNLPLTEISPDLLQWMYWKQSGLECCKLFGSSSSKKIQRDFFSSSPFYPLSCCWSFNLSCHCRLASRLELGNQVGSTADHLSSCCLIQHTEDLSMMRAELAEVIANRELMNFNYPQKA